VPREVGKCNRLIGGPHRILHRCDAHVDVAAEVAAARAGLQRQDAADGVRDRGAGVVNGGDEPVAAEGELVAGADGDAGEERQDAAERKGVQALELLQAHARIVPAARTEDGHQHITGDDGTRRLAETAARSAPRLHFRAQAKLVKHCRLKVVQSCEVTHAMLSQVSPGSTW